MTPLRLDSACCQLANWRTDFSDRLDPAGFEQQMLAAGWTSRCQHPALKVFRHPVGHEVAWVVTTGRVQIRIDFEVPESSRRQQAAELYEQLAVLVRRGGVGERAVRTSPRTRP